jgi:hypothetical protein
VSNALPGNGAWGFVNSVDEGSGARGERMMLWRFVASWRKILARKEDVRFTVSASQ